jgi:signal transduction histidine kinase
MIEIKQNNFTSIAVVLAVALALILVSPGLLQTLLTANDFMPHGHCYLWRPGLVWLHIGSDSLIALAYIAISAALAYLVYKTRQEIPFHWMFLAFGSFIIACASTHVMEVWTLWHPTYWLSGGLKLITAIASVTTAIALPPLIPKALALLEAAKLSEERRHHLETANQELETLYGKLKELDQLKSQFFANVSHELRTPLALILGPTEKLLTDAELNDEQQRTITVIDRNARILLKQVNDLLDVSKIEAGKMQLHYSQIDLAELVRLTTANFEGIAEEQQISLTIETPDSVSAQLDAEKVQRILLNLLANAFKFTPQGGSIRCVLSTQSDAHDATSVDRAVITIQDSGPGVPPDLWDAIFERFRQGEGGTTRRFGGTGLGLAIVKEFVELQGGTVIVGEAPAPQGGALFTVELPLKAPADNPVSPIIFESIDAQSVVLPVLEQLQATIAADHPTSDWEDLKKPLVLVVEDNPEMNRFVADTLRSDYRVATAFDGQKGLEQALALRPDLILSDIMMPHMSGEQLVRQFRRHSTLDTTPVVMLTAKSDNDLRVQLLRESVQDYLMKPFSVEELRVRVHNLIAIKRTRDLLQQELASQSSNIEALAEEVSLRKRELQIALNELQHQAKELEQANRVKDEFLAIVSHELRTPLNMILGWVRILRTRQLDQPRTAQALETIERNATLQNQLIENLIDISRLLRGKLHLNLRSITPQPILQSAIRAVQPQADAKAIQLDCTLDASVGAIWVDPQRLQQIAERLLDNAIKFTPNGGRIEIRLECCDAEARLQISDTGEGIDPEVLPYIFDYFRQADSSTTRKHNGLGLGLAIVRQLVELQKGTVTAASLGEGQGATFTVSFPLLDVPAVTPCCS